MNTVLDLFRDLWNALETPRPPGPSGSRPQIKFPISKSYLPDDTGCGTKGNGLDVVPGHELPDG